ncbi:MAG TPA: hypothetical protein VM347_43140 [Nonomuraea sp.]|nr:hypothetical protein [Nonomuraea sp.]
MTNRARIVVLAERPVPGREPPPYSLAETAGPAADALDDTLPAVATTLMAARALAGVAGAVR